MRKKIIWLSLILLPAISHAQFDNLLKKAKDKVTKRVDDKINKEMDKKLDEMEGKQTGSTTAPTNQTYSTPPTQPLPTSQSNTTKKTAPVAPAPESVKSFSKFDFVPGERIIYAEDFAQDAIGELPLTWNSSGKGEIMKLDKHEGNWLRAFQNNVYLTGNKKTFGENFTIEFDLMFFFDPKVKGYVLPGWDFGMFSSGGTEPSDNSFLKERAALNLAEVRFGFGSYALARMESKAKRTSTFLSDNMQLGEVLPSFNKIVHYSVQVQKTRFRLWIDEKKVFDIPRAINTADTLNQVYFKMDGSNYKEDEIGLFISNLKIATGLPDARHKLVEEGKFSTTGILFDVNAATIKPESAGVLKEIADVLKTNGGLRVKIIGHTDSDGADAANLDLSKRRADAVKTALVKDWNIDSALLQTDGKGESNPAADNKTKEGKAQNRRVEFVKIK